jgi:hypothetical protein
MLKFNSDDAKDLSGSLSQCKSVYTHEWEQVQRNWQDLERTWYDHHHDKFSVTFEPILRSYHDSIEQLNHHISQLERLIGVTEVIKESLQDISSVNSNYNRSSLLESTQVNAENPDSEIPIILPEILPLTLFLGFLICDANIIYNADKRFRMSDLCSNPAASHYSEKSQQPIGDLGEKVVWAMLVDELGPIDSERIKIKPKLESNITEHIQKPDFHIPAKDKTSSEIIVDSKAWKSFRSKAIEAVIKKYMGLKCLSDGGEIRLYFPSNVFSNLRPKTLEKFHGPRGNILVKILPMKAEHQELRKNSEIIKLLFKMFQMPKTKPPQL